MGVLACDKKGCDSIMCDTYIPSVGYICRHCEKDFETFCKGLRTPPSTEKEFLNCLKQFMEQEKQLGSDNKMTVHQFLKLYNDES